MSRFAALTLVAGAAYWVENPRGQGLDANGAPVGEPKPVENFAVSLANRSEHFGEVGEVDGRWKFVAGEEGATGELVFAGTVEGIHGDGGYAVTLGKAPNPGEITSYAITATLTPVA